MPHDTPLITTIVVSFALAFVFGALANRLRISPLVGYLVAGALVGPATPGYVADVGLATQLAEIGVVLLMFGVGLHFSLKDLLSVKAIAIPGAVGQIALATLMGLGLSQYLGWSWAAGVVFGLALSVASTVVLLRALQERRLVDTERGRIAVGWLIVEDLAMVLALVLLPALANMLEDNPAAASASAGSSLLLAIGTTAGKIAAFVAIMLIVGRRVIPWTMHYVAHTGSRELFRLSVLAIALSVAFGAAELFGVSFALGAFFAGLILSESTLSQRAAEESLPLRDAFAVIFFVSVGMLFDPMILVREPWPVLATLLIIVFGKSVAAFLIVRAFGHSRLTAFTISASLAQIGEFSFILAALGVGLGLLPKAGQDLILAGSILSILANPAFFALLDWFQLRSEAGATDREPSSIEANERLNPTSLTNHAVLVGFGRVGGLIGDALEGRGDPFLVIEADHGRIERLRARSIEAISGNAVRAELLAAANIAGARWLFVAIPDSFEAGQIVAQTRAVNPDLAIIARAHSEAAEAHLRAQGASMVIMGEREIAGGMLQHAFGALSRSVAGPGAPADGVTYPG